ncbi:MAG: SDR family oxidoreductase [Alphaproteobacteria bacterium]|nr:MAG: SDR family oxidoreductase [Alphaproteobacteria bacterium]
MTAHADKPAGDELAGRVALVTGASRGIGWATARALAALGAHVVVNGHSDPDGLAARAAELTREFGVMATAISADIGDAKAVGDMYRRILQELGRLDILVANAGILEAGRLGMIAPDSIERVLRTNTAGAVHLLQGAARLMPRTKPDAVGGAIVLVSSIVGRRGHVGQSVYAAAKAGLIGLALSAAKELGPQGIRVNVVAPGLIDTEMARTADAATLQSWIDRTALGRIGRPEEVADAIAFLVSPRAAFISGQVLGVDGCIT